MGHGDERVRTALRCRQCGSIYPGWHWPDGTVRIIGRDDCECGSSDFEVLEEADVLPTDSEP